MAYAKLFNTITDSSLWGASKEARILFVSMLARCDQVGFIEAALPGLARMANLSIPETESALAELMAPDPYSKSTVAEGRRVAKVERGWCLVNYEAYRNQRHDDERREYMRNYMANYRKQVKANVNKNKENKPGLAQADADATATAEAHETSNTQKSPPPPPQQDLFGPDKPALPPVPMVKTFGDFQATHPRIHVGREERESWVATFQTWGWDPMDRAYHATAKTLTDPKHRVLLSMITKFIDDHYEIVKEAAK